MKKTMITAIFILSAVFINPICASQTKFETTKSLLQTLSYFEGSTPQENCLYDLFGMVVTQVVKDGALITTNPYYGLNYSRYPAVFLYTSKAFVDGESLGGYWAYYVGTYRYTTVLGAQKTVYAFKLYDKKNAGEEAKKIAEAEYERINKSNPDHSLEKGRAYSKENNNDPGFTNKLKETEPESYAYTFLMADIGQQTVTAPGTQTSGSFGFGIGKGYGDSYLALGISSKQSDNNSYFSEIFGKIGKELFNNIFAEIGIGTQWLTTTLSGPNKESNWVTTFMAGTRIRLSEEISVYTDYHSQRKIIAGLSFSWKETK